MYNFNNTLESMQEILGGNDVVRTLCIGGRCIEGGVKIKEFNSYIDDEDLVITDDGDIEFIYPLSWIDDIQYDEFDNCFCLNMNNSIQILLSTT